MAQIGVAAWVAIASAVASASAAVITSAQQSKAADKQAEIYAEQAEQAKHAAKIKAENYKKEAAARMGQMRSAYSYSGVESTEGTPLLVLMESAAEAAEDVERVKQTGEDQAWGLLSQASISRMQGSSAMIGGVMGAGTSLLGGAARLYNK